MGKQSAIEPASLETVPEYRSGKGFAGEPRHEDLVAMVDAALRFCTLRSNKPIGEVVRRIKKSDLWANSTLRYALAKEIRKVLSSDPDVCDVYLMGSVIDDQARLASDLDLILHVRGEKETYETWLVLFDKGLTELFRKRFGLGQDFISLIDYHVVNDQEVNQRTGYGSLLTSTHHNLTRLS